MQRMNVCRSVLSNIGLGVLALGCAWFLFAWGILWLNPASPPAEPAPPVVDQPVKPPIQPTQPVCATDYYALFQLADRLGCAADPTAQLAFNGPPDATWFYPFNGVFNVTPQDLLPSSICRCLAQTEPYQVVEDTLSVTPIAELVWQEQVMPIAAWVCADRSCLNLTGDK